MDYPNNYTQKFCRIFEQTLIANNVIIMRRVPMDYSEQYHLRFGDLYRAYVVDEMYMILSADIEGNAEYLGKHLAREFRDTLVRTFRE